jgi:hypothetical protein
VYSSVGMNMPKHTWAGAGGEQPKALNAWVWGLAGRAPPGGAVARRYGPPAAQLLRVPPEISTSARPAAAALDTERTPLDRINRLRLSRRGARTGSSRVRLSTALGLSCTKREATRLP